MATKKQKREQALAKRAKFDAEIKAEGLAALQRDREFQAAITEMFLQEAAAINARHRQILTEASLAGRIALED